MYFYCFYGVLSKQDDKHNNDMHSEVLTATKPKGKHCRYLLQRIACSRIFPLRFDITLAAVVIAISHACARSFMKVGSVQNMLGL